MSQHAAASIALSIFVLNLMGAAPACGFDPGRLYEQHCASCHGDHRLGGIGPALLPENLIRLKPDAAGEAVARGLPATQMPGFAGVLEEAEIRALVDYIYTPPASTPNWDLASIRDSRLQYFESDALPDHPVYDADRLNLFLVVETGDHHVTVMDGDTFAPIHRFKSRYALHGGPKYSGDGRFVYLSSRDGWISKFDLFSLQLVAEVRAGINTRNLAVSRDGRFVLVGNYLPHTVVLLDARDLSPIKLIPATGRDGASSRVSAVYDAPPRQSFVVALKDAREVWEISYADEPPYYGKVHDYRYEGTPKLNEPFPVRRIQLDDYLDDFFFDPDYRNVIGAARNARKAQVVSLLVGRKIAEIDLGGLPHLGSGITWNHKGRAVFATPNLTDGVVTVVSMDDWQVVRRIETLGPGFFMRSHEQTPYAWVDVFFGAHRDAMHVIDKRTLEIVKTLRPSPGQTSGHVEFTRDGRYALVSIWEMDGAVVVYDAATLQEVKRVPMRKPSGKYNVYNKITGSAGTSH